MGLARNALLWASRNEWLAERVPDVGFVQRAVRKFMPGEQLANALAAAERLRAGGMSSIVTHLGENVADEADAKAAAAAYHEALDEVAARGLDTEISVKLTHLGLDLGDGVAAGHLDGLVARAAELGNFVWVDMEDSTYVDRTLDLYEAGRRVHDNVGIAIQAYLRRTPADLARLLPLRPAIRLVKGAYREPPHAAFQTVKEVDQAFLLNGAWLLGMAGDGDVRVGLGSHDVELVERVIADAGAGVEDFEIQMLYGIRTADQRRLAAAGHDVRVLISYGEGWYPWYVRRLAERPANVGFVLRNAFARDQEA